MLGIGSLDGSRPCHGCGRKIEKGEFGTSNGQYDWCRECSDKRFDNNQLASGESMACFGGHSARQSDAEAESEYNAVQRLLPVFKKYIGDENMDGELVVGEMLGQNVEKNNAQPAAPAPAPIVNDAVPQCSCEHARGGIIESVPQVVREPDYKRLKPYKVLVMAIVPIAVLAESEEEALTKAKDELEENDSITEELFGTDLDDLVYKVAMDGE
jgi:hypothetical protein